MLKLLEADFYKMLKNKGFWIFTILTIFFQAISIPLSNSENNSYDEIFFSNKFLYLFACIFVSNFIRAEFRVGSMRNIVSRGHIRNKIYFSKIISCFCACQIFLLTGVLTDIILGGIIRGFGVFPKCLFKYYTCLLLWSLAWICVITCFSMTISKTHKSTIINITLFFVPVLIEMIDDYLNKIHLGSIKINLTNYWITNLSFGAPEYLIPKELLVKYIAACFVYIILFTCFGLYRFNKVEINVG